MLRGAGLAAPECRLVVCGLRRLGAWRLAPFPGAGLTAPDRSGSISPARGQLILLRAEIQWSLGDFLAWAHGSLLRARRAPGVG
jgi:hypothetical protein